MELRKHCFSNGLVVHSLQVVRLVCRGLASPPPISHSSLSRGLVASCFTHAPKAKSQEVARLRAFFSVQALVAVTCSAQTLLKNLVPDTAARPRANRLG